ncbi:hypothetical protein HWV62_10963 [Athelia sp. TMB]|nr:hypothetical protein HWV62_10963 [Athelia sp. TMB]
MGLLSTTPDPSELSRLAKGGPSKRHMQTSNGYYPYDEDDRKNRFLSPITTTSEPRAASQPPQSNAQGFGMSSPTAQHPIPSSLNSGGLSPWGTRGASGLNPSARPIPQSVPTRSSSFSSHTPSQFSSAMRERAFASTFEDDESEVFDDYDERFLPPFRGRTYAQDLTRSRSQSLATATRPGAIGSPLAGTGMWGDPPSALSIPGARYGEIQPPGGSRYGSLGTSGRSLSNNFVSPTNNGYSTGGANDVSNMSPFRRDVGAILLDEGSAFRELWAGMNPPRDENGGGGSGTTSRRHSVSVVQPRRGGTAVVGFNAPGNDGDEPARPAAFASKSYGRGGLMLSDDDLASDLGNLDLGYAAPAPPAGPTPASLPIYAPLSRSPPSDRLTPYQSISTLAIPGGSSFPARAHHRGSPSESGLSTGSPTRSNASPFDAQQQQLTARFIPGQGIQYLPPALARAGSNSGAHAAPSPLSPRAYPAPAPPMQRRASDAAAPLSELGKGVPLHSVPAAWPLYIVEFKAGRTDLFYSTDLAADIRVGDLVLVEADRGKDLGTVVNDSITLQEVEAFQREQQARAGFGDAPPLSPGGNTSGGGGAGAQAPGQAAKKEINPKMIYGKAQPQDTQLLMVKSQDEMKALQLCQTKVRQKKLPMEVVDAEYQWDRRKLTFYFVAEKRIDFRELVRELFRLYKTRIWMASLQGPAYDQ